MEFSVSSINKFLFFKLPSAYWTGVRLRRISDTSATTTVRHKWVNQNPFRSMYFAVQAMAAELSTGALVMKKISESGQRISMLVAQNNSVFVKKATGKISFTCNEGHLLDEAIQKAIETQEGVTVWMKSVGIDEKGDEVSVFNFEWTLKVRVKK
ncbi:DUF4442 domain-containing protein [Myroides odoratus]|jgi:hypothetical protein|uniref:DUF4442 domain-containing protein n=1 Tax=Myroides odoratus TaxID=256 RepID=A0A9Q6Z369_MYROD|nr:DUF4442 domain-containing protein [Myroides odoratus]EHQ41702.1 hypothetical protein Myrod_0866 [Myroides odoratus DSM 2801]EKB08917.1 hypothetical protein HMPREF9716_00578 [Myroides odoratus CIP 103059]QQT99108.1 DUF4442 domain-containing protein [Myroides odoratus]WQD58699.1 DUF4442 domain-containing protein [Myroides odoratus]STZ28961.1 Uncharacterised protein [Myroides odoratus]